jgi:hypothetical protein
MSSFSADSPERGGAADSGSGRPPEEVSSHRPTGALLTWRALDLTDRLRLGAWKLRAAARGVLDSAGVGALHAAAAHRYATKWRRDWRTGGIAAWLARPGAGRFAFDAEPLVWAAAACTGADSALADQTAAGVFDLIGSGPVELGTPPRWRIDLYSGVEWPLVAAAKLPRVRGDGSDIRTVWELSRCYHFLALARAFAATRDARYADAFASHVRSFVADNPIGFGPHWASPMDVAIRCANWCLVTPVFATAHSDAAFWAELLGNLRASGRHLERHLEWHPVYRGNHYLANLVGLLYLGVLFRGTRDGDRWLRLAAAELPAELAFQVAPDGVCREAALGYHRLVTELFARAGELLQRNRDDFPAAAYQAGLERMYAFLRAYLQPDGRAPLLGDADDGCLHLMDPVLRADPRRHDRGLPAVLADAPADGVHAFPDGGFYVLRCDDDHAIIRCGPVGLRGAGSHDHNDQLSLELVAAGRRIVADSGTYAYTRDLAARHAFRSTAAHSVVQLGGEEQNPIDARLPWRILADRTRSECLSAHAGADVLTFEGRHYGYVHRPSRAACSRRLQLDRRTRAWSIVDTILGKGAEDMTWRLHLDPDSAVVLDPPGNTRRRTAIVASRTDAGPRVRLELELPAGLELAIEASPISERYGIRSLRPVMVARGSATLPCRIACVLRPDAGPDRE